MGIAFVSCKKDEDNNVPKVDLSQLSGEWERGSTVYNLSFIPSVNEVIYDPLVVDPPTQKGGKVTHWFTDGQPSPIPDIDYKEWGDVQITYAQYDEASKATLLLGDFDYQKKERTIGPVTTNMQAPRTPYQILWKGDPDKLDINGSTHTRKE